MPIASDPISRLPRPNDPPTLGGAAPPAELRTFDITSQGPATSQPDILGYQRFQQRRHTLYITSAVMAGTSLPRLEVLDSASPPSFSTPTKRIHETSDVSRFLTSFAYRDIGIFILQLTHAVCPRNKPDSAVPLTFQIFSRAQTSPAVQALQELLRKIEKIIEEAPPASGPRRFGNISFRKWYEIVEERASSMLQEGLLGETLGRWDEKALAEVRSYLLGGFGSAQRLDYGTGHELSFLAFIGCLWKLGHFQDANPPEETERQIVFQVVEPYLQLIRNLITTYTLEPAGSHGVWGLDDHSFAPYIFGSAQLTRPINDTDPMPTEGSVRGAPKPANVTKATVVDDYRQTNMYFSAIGFINDIKKGPFWEHSPMLFDISGIRDGWGKINKGMIKMYNAEVLSKFPVVQHFPFGSIFSWDVDPNASVPPSQSSSGTSTPDTAATASAPPGPAPPAAGTAAPWASSTRAPPTMAGTGAPWAASSRVPPGAGPGVQGAPSTRMPPPPSGTQGRTTDDVPSTKAPWAK